jgi:hypothetical protein
MADQNNNTESPAALHGITHKDSVLLYDVKPWNAAGYGVPNFGSTVQTQNVVIHKLVDTLGEQQLMIMTHVDAGRANALSRNILEKLGKLLNYALTVLESRGRASNEKRLEAHHKTPAPKPWVLHPVPYFPVSGAWIENADLIELNELFMYALTEAMQHTENDLALEVTSEFVADVGQFILRALHIVAGILGVPKAEYTAPGFRITPAHYDAYDHSQVPRSEAIRMPRTIGRRPTEVDLAPLATGLYSTDLIPVLKVFSDPLVEWNGSQNQQKPHNEDEKNGSERNAFDPVI